MSAIRRPYARVQISRQMTGFRQMVRTVPGGALAGAASPSRGGSIMGTIERFGFQARTRAMAMVLIATAISSMAAT